MALSAWQRDDSELRQMRAAAEEFRGLTLEPVSPSIKLRRGETLLWTAPSIRMIEVRYQPALRRPGYEEFSLSQVRPLSMQPPSQANVVDLGSVAVTSQRVIFQGSRRGRDWAFAKLVGIVHEAKAPCTLMQVSNRKRVSGLLLDPARGSRGQPRAV